MGIREKRRILKVHGELISANQTETEEHVALQGEGSNSTSKSEQRPKMIWVNGLLSLSVGASGLVGDLVIWPRNA